jgi:predicted ATP-grasp superfamily ATP-dependent carboligase
VTDWVPEAKELGEKLFRHVGLRGLANVEFKLDKRDGKLKLIECNARFTASDCLVASSGFRLAEYVYNRLTGRALPEMKTYELGRRLWDPIRDFQAGMQLRKAGRMTLWGWVKSVMHRQTFPYFQWSDPMPGLARLTLPMRKKVGLVRKSAGRQAASGTAVGTVVVAEGGR